MSSQPVGDRVTLRLTATAEDIARAAQILRDGGTVAFPTETVYGLGANALDAAAVSHIFIAKERPHWDPLIVHVSSRAMLSQVAVVTPLAERLIDAFWPGPLTLLLQRTDNVPDAVTAKRPLVGVRMPAHPTALALIEASGLPVAAPSANRFGRTSPTTASHVLEDLDRRIDAVLDGGPTTVGVESTVLDPNQSPAVIYRPGAITPAMLEPIIGPSVFYQPAPTTTEPESLPSPGVGLRHYAPRAHLILVAGRSELDQHISRFTAERERIGIMLPSDWTVNTRSAEVFSWSDFEDTAALAHSLFSGLRELDARGVSVILCPLPNVDGLGAAIRDRLEKAAKLG
jgi:L-threonylcarbamoyladenylate synthase